MKEIKIICIRTSIGSYNNGRKINKGEILNIYEYDFNGYINKDYILLLKGMYNKKDFITLEEFRVNRLVKILNND